MTAAPTIDADFSQPDEPTTALATQNPAGGGLLATSQYQAIRAISKQVSESRMYGRKSEAEAFCIITTGVEMGLSPFQALRSIHIIDGRPSPSSDLMVALARRHPDCEYFEAVEVTNQKATYRTKRIGRPEQVRSFTIEDAKRAKLLGKDNWQKYPADMLRARAASKLARQVYPESTGGLYIPEELESVGAAEVVSQAATDETIEATFEEDASEPTLSEGAAKKRLLAAIESTLGLADESAKEHARQVWNDAGLAAPVLESDLRAVIANLDAQDADVAAENNPHDVFPMSDEERQRVYARVFAKLTETGHSKDEVDLARRCWVAAEFDVSSFKDLSSEQVEKLAELVDGKTNEELDAWVAEWADIARQAAKDAS